MINEKPESIYDSLILKNPIPIILDSPDSHLRYLLAKKDRFLNYSLELKADSNIKVSELIRIVKTEISKRNKIIFDKDIIIHLENNIVPHLDIDVFSLYNMYKNPDDDILYLLINFENKKSLLSQIFYFFR
jgi:hypothetical protein